MGSRSTQIGRSVVDHASTERGCCRSIGRRTALKMTLGVVVGLDLAPIATAQNVDASSIRPQSGDRLVFADGERHGNIISVADLQLGGPQVNAFPTDPVGRLVRDGSRLSKILLVRSDPETLNEETRRRAVDGI